MWWEGLRQGAAITIGAAPQPMGVVGMIPLSGGVKDTHAIAQASRSNIGIFINQKDD